MNGINSKDRFSFAKGYRARTIFLIFDILLLGILMCMMVLPLLKGEQPSMVADSNSSFGMLAKKLRIRMVL